MTYPPQPSEPTQQPEMPPTPGEPVQTSPGPEPVTPQPPKRNRGLIVGAIAGGAVLLIAATIAATMAITRGGKPNTFDVSGTFTIHGDTTMRSGSCVGAGGYDDISDGTQVTVTDQAGTVIGVGELADGSELDSDTCAFPFTVKSVPSGKPFYGVAVSHRGTLRYTEAQLKHDLRLTLG